MNHTPVLLKESLKYLDPKPNENFVDGTAGTGGHSMEILKMIGPNGKLLAIDLNEGLLKALSLKIKNLGYASRFIPVCGNFKDIDQIVEHMDLQNIQGIILDLGLNTDLLESSERGFSFLKDEPLDMRYGNTDLIAYEIVNTYPEDELETILKEYGEERFSRRIAHSIVESRRIKKIETTKELVGVILRSVPAFYTRLRIHPATKTFQALRIATNDELNNLQQAIPKALSLMATGARMVIISYHSLEDRITKIAFRNLSKLGKLQLLIKKPITPTPEEIVANPRARSAKLRAIIKN